MTEESAVKVCVRIRPLVAREENAGSENSEPVKLFWKADKKSIHQLDDGSSSRSFSFDRVFTADETTNQLYQTIAKPLVVSSVGGYNGTVFAYGQTCSGKTFTMMGSDRNPGVIPLAVEDVFQTIKDFPKKEFLLRVSYMEIYNETVTDLLVDSWKRKPLEVRETINKNICVADLTEELVTSPAQALAWVRKGEKNRHYAKTKMNQRSSRSHAIFRMILESREISDPASGDIGDGAIIVSHLNLVDLAGSERASQTGAEGARFKEGCNINRSLFMLGQVIKKLTDESQKGFTNYRDSKLTRILQNSLGGNAKTVIICTVTPATVEETLSTLQFASTAKKMKNDPHVTEVSDDGALLKRYRNEIVELKQRLQEVSSVTQTTATEKEVLSQLLQEKDQLQREQEDRIKNLTKLLVTSSNLVPVQRMPKRRVTWGGHMLKSAHQAACDDDDDFVSDLSFAGPFSRKGKAHNFGLTELSEADEYFDSQWGNLEEPSDEMETSEGSVTTRSFGDSSREYFSPGQACELSQKVSSLELQLEMEIQQREEAIKQTESLDARLAELQLQLQTETLQKQEVEQKVEELEQQLQERSHDGSKQMRREFAETIQLCETLVSEKDTVIAERDYLKQELGMFMEQTQHLEKEKAALSKELKEKRELDEFESLEDQFSQERENELHNEICSLKQAIKSSEAQCLELQNTLQNLSKELKQKTELSEELQRMNDKDLVQELVNLRRSLDDAEGLSRDTKKEWAFLRSENISLKELNATLTAKQEKMDADMNSVLSQLETEKSRYKMMQSDLQKELKIAFDENTKLTSLKEVLLSGQSVSTQSSAETEKLLSTITSLSTERDQLLKDLQTHVDKATETDGLLLSLQQELQEQQQKNVDLMTSSEQKESELEERILKLSQELQVLQEEKVVLQVSAAESSSEEVEKLLSAVASITAERDQLKDDLQENVEMMIENQEELRSALEKNRELVKKIKLLEAEKAANANPEDCGSQLEELQGKMRTLTEELESIRTERDVLMLEKEASSQAPTEEMEKLQSRVSSLSEERDQLQETLEGLREEKKQLREELEDRILMVAETQTISCSLEEELQQPNQYSEMQRINLEEREQLEQQLSETKCLLQSLQEELKTNLDLVKLYEQRESDYEQQMKSLTEELADAHTERDALVLEKEAKCQTPTEEMEKLQSRVSSLSEERDQLQETLEGLREEKKQLREELEDRIQMMQCEFQQQQLTSEPETRQLQIEQLEEMLKNAKEEISHLKFDLQENVKLMTEKQEELESSQEKSRVLEEELAVLKLQVVQLESLQSSRNEAEKTIQSLESKVQMLTEELESVRESGSKAHTEEMETLQSRVSSLSEERDQLQETLEGLREEKQQLREELEDRIQMMQCEFQQQQQMTSEPETRQLQIEQLEEMLKNAKEEMGHLKFDLQENVKLMTEKQEELESSQEKSRVLEEELTVLKLQVVQLESLQSSRNEAERTIQSLESKVQMLTEELESVRESGSKAHTEEMEKLQSRVSSLSEERDQLQETLEDLREEKKQLREELEDRMETLQAETDQLNVSLKTLTEKNRQLKDDLQQQVEKELSTQELLSTAQDELQEQINEKLDLEKLLQEKESSLHQKISDLVKNLESVEAERNSLQSEKETSHQTHTEELQELLRRVSSLSEESDQLEGLREEKKRLREDLEDRIRMISAIQEKLSQQEQWNIQQQSEREEREAELQHKVQQLEECLKMQIEQQTCVIAEADASQQLLDEAKSMISALKQQLNSCTKGGEEIILSQLEDSTSHLQESIGKFQGFLDASSKYNTTPLNKVLRIQCSLNNSLLSSLPKAVLVAYRAVQMHGFKTVGNFVRIQEELRLQAMSYRKVFEELVNKDLAIFEESRLQDLLLSRAHAPTLSLGDVDFRSVWEQRLCELLNKRQLYLHKMHSLLEKLQNNMASYETEERAEICEREKFNEQLQRVISSQTFTFNKLDGILSQEASRRSATTQTSRMSLQLIINEENVFDEMRELVAESQSRLGEEKSKSSTLLQALEGAPLKTEVSLLRDNQQLVLQLQQAEENIKMLHEQMEELEETQTKANHSVSQHKQATQLLQTKLQDTRALVQEKDDTIQNLKRELQESEKKASPGAAEMEKLHNKVFQMEVKLTSISDQHEQEIQRMNTVLSEKEESLRKTKEALRRSQQQGDDSFLQGEDLHARLTNPRGVLIKSSIALEKTKLEERVQQLQLKITELESLVSSQQAEVSKWKNRAIKLKGKSKAEVDKTSPCTPTKRGYPMTSDPGDLNSPVKRVLVSSKKLLASPQKGLESPLKTLHLGSPKSRFFDNTESSDLLFTNRPTRFFDNSKLGTITDAEPSSKDLWPQSPTQEEMCKTQ